jgi:hypothetical protein
MRLRIRQRFPLFGTTKFSLSVADWTGAVWHPFGLSWSHSEHRWRWIDGAEYAILCPLFNRGRSQSWFIRRNGIDVCEGKLIYPHGGFGWWPKWTWSIGDFTLYFVGSSPCRRLSRLVAAAGVPVAVWYQTCNAECVIRNSIGEQFSGIVAGMILATMLN